ncbi:MAG: nucleotidyltransferase domain-containing protein [Candidatus Coatesbacteria bacterium]|nr:nucleotidyltransferase domain-containing protein [Candidatus Coatesbacteria bacterium]
MDQAPLAKTIIETLESSGKFRSVELIGSVADGTQDEYSDIDLLIQDDSRPPYENVELASTIIEASLGLLLRDWARSLIPDKYLINQFLPGVPIFWWIDIGCLSSPEYDDLSPFEIDWDLNEHFAKLIMMSAKHYLRGDLDRLCIRQIHRRLFRDAPDDLPVKELFRQIYDRIDYTTISPEFHEKTKVVMEDVYAKAFT